MKVICSKCGHEIEAEKGYEYCSKIFCEDCLMDVRMTRSRKTHWQYLRSIKNEYLIPACETVSQYQKPVISDEGCKAS